MRFSVWPSNQRSWPEILYLAQHAEATGWDGLWVSDHLMGMAGEPDADILEAWTSLAALAAVTTRLRLGTLVTGLGYRHPGLVAKMAVTVDQVSGGRLTLGLGTGWQANEHEAFGVPLARLDTRAALLDEACEVIRALLDGEHVTYQGKHLTIRHAVARPRPRQAKVPLLVGGTSRRHLLPVVGRRADLWNAWALPADLVRGNRELDHACELAGRDPGELRRTAQALVYLGDDQTQVEAARQAGPRLPALAGNSTWLADQVAAFQAAGADELIVPDFTMGTLEATKDTLDRFLTEVAAPFRRQPGGHR